MDNIINENENIKTSDHFISSGYNRDIKIGMDKNLEDEDGQHMLIATNLAMEKNKNFIENENLIISNLSWRDLYSQVFFSCISLLMVIQPGINLAFSNNLLQKYPSLKTGEQFSWITSVLALSTPIGAIMNGAIMDRIGRKKACILCCLTLLVSWILASMTTHEKILMFYASRIVAGIGAGMSTVSIVYVSEISHSSYRQILLSLNSVFFSGGILTATSLANLDLNVANSAFIWLTIANIVLIIIFLPESPIWLLKFKSSKNVDKAKAAMKKIYPKNDQVFKAEWNRLYKATADHLVATSATDRPSFVQSLRSSPAAYKPMAVLMGLLLMQQLSGSYAAISYALPVIESAMATAGTGALSMLGAVRFVAALIACPLSFYVGRRPLLMVSCAGMVATSALIALAPAELTANGAHVPLALCAVMLYVFSSSMGVLVFPWTLTCELLPTSVRAVGGSLLVSYAYVLMFGVLKVFPLALAMFGLAGVFLAFGAVSLLMAVYVYVAVPETLGKSFQEIEDYFTDRPPLTTGGH